jgi:tyrosyl-tRNA synthetase
MDQIEELLSRRVQDIFPSKDLLEKKLRSGKKIKLYQGFDPSSPNLHIGHLVGLLQLKMFQDLGHEVIFLIGDFTGMIGDPTDKTATRPKLTHDQIIVNAQTYKDQAGKILRFDGHNPVKMFFNYNWLSKLTFADLIEITSNLTVQQLIERDMFQERLKKNAPIHLHEFLYPVAQGYDSVHMDVDLEIGGNDQMFNLMIGRQLMKALKGKEKFCLTTRLLTDSQGRKVGKTTGNAVNLFGKPADLYGGLMALPDDTIIPALELITQIPISTIEELKSQLNQNPMSLKQQLAFEVTRMIQGAKEAQQAQDHFKKTVQHKQAPEDIKTVTLKTPTLTALELIRHSGVGESNAQIKRVIEQGGVELYGQKITSPNQSTTVKSGMVLKFGKRQFIKIVKE